jgi:hypothetical protein
MSVDSDYKGLEFDLYFDAYVIEARVLREILVMAIFLGLTSIWIIVYYAGLFVFEVSALSGSENACTQLD